MQGVNLKSSSWVGLFYVEQRAWVPPPDPISADAWLLKNSTNSGNSAGGYIPRVWIPLSDVSDVMMTVPTIRQAWLEAGEWWREPGLLDQQGASLQPSRSQVGGSLSDRGACRLLPASCPCTCLQGRRSCFAVDEPTRCRAQAESTRALAPHVLVSPAAREQRLGAWQRHH